MTNLAASLTKSERCSGQIFSVCFRFDNQVHLRFDTSLDSCDSADPPTLFSYFYSITHIRLHFSSLTFWNIIISPSNLLFSLFCTQMPFNCYFSATESSNRLFRSLSRLLVRMSSRSPKKPTQRADSKSRLMTHS